jgi:hypothetical protein
MTWLVNNEPFDVTPDNYEGFVYKITNLQTGKAYIGKKIFHFKKPKTVTLKNGKKVKRKVKVESDWKDYYGSSPALRADIEKLGVENFKREILYFCETRGMMGYLEAKLQMIHEVLEYPELWYNGQVMCRISGSHVKVNSIKKVYV